MSNPESTSLRSFPFGREVAPSDLNDPMFFWGFVAAVKDRRMGVASDFIMVDEKGQHLFRWIGGADRKIRTETVLLRCHNFLTRREIPFGFICDLRPTGFVMQKKDQLIVNPVGPIEDITDVDVLILSGICNNRKEAIRHKRGGKPEPFVQQVRLKVV